MGILDLIQSSRNTFLSSSSFMPSSLKIYSNKEKKVFGIERQDQASINYDELRHKIAYQLGVQEAYPQFTQLFGDSQLFSPKGTQFAYHVLNDFINIQYPKSIILYGFTGKHDPIKKSTDVNHLLSLMVDNKQVDAKRVLANVVDFHTVLAIKEWPGVCISENVNNFTLIYTNSEKPGARFGDDTPTTDHLTNTAAICFEGGIQSLLQSINLVNKGVPILGVTGLRDLSDLRNPLAYEVESGKPYLSAIHFLHFMKEKVKKNKEWGETEVKDWTSEYLNKFALTSSKAKDVDTKSALWNEAMKKFVDNRIGDKLDHLKVIACPTKEIKDLVTTNNERSLLYPTQPSSTPLKNMGTLFNIKKVTEEKGLTSGEKNPFLYRKGMT